MKKFTKRLISVVLAVILVLSTFAFSVTAASANLIASTKEESYMQGEEIVVTVYFSAAYSKAAALNLELNYDKAKLDYVDAKVGAGLKKALDAQPNGTAFSQNLKAPGKVVWVLAGSNNFDFNGVFATVTFKVKSSAANGPTTFDLNVTHAANSGYVDITSQVTVEDKTVEIIRDSVNDFEFTLNAAKNGYIATAYRCATVANLTVPTTYNGLPVVEIADKVFYNHGELVSVVLPDHLAKIGTQAFASCSKLQKVEIPDSVESIGESAFANCASLESINLPLGLTEIQASTFYACYFLESIEIPFQVKKIGVNAFYNCLLLSKVKISKNTTEIAKGAFDQCFAEGIEFTTVEGNKFLPDFLAANYPKATIKKVEDISLGKVSEIKTEVEYTGAPYKPEVKVTLNNGKKVEAGKDYKVVYVNNVAAGNGKVYVVGIDGYGEGYVNSFSVVCKHSTIEKTVAKKPTCTVDGKNICQCAYCGYSYEEVIKAPGHQGGEWVIDKLPTYDKTGIKHRICAICSTPYAHNTKADKIVPDVNLDSRVNSSDALLVLQRSVGKSVYIDPKQGIFNADPNGDGNLNSSDALIILKISVGKIKL